MVDDCGPTKTKQNKNHTIRVGMVDDCDPRPTQPVVTMGDWSQTHTNSSDGGVTGSRPTQPVVTVG